MFQVSTSCNSVCVRVRVRARAVGATGMELEYFARGAKSEPEGCDPQALQVGAKAFWAVFQQQ